MKRRVRIQDIADELNMSTATVSNVIHGKTRKISDETVRVVQRALEEHGYLPGVAAELLGQNDSRIVGVVVKNHEKYEGHVFQDPFVSAALNFLSDEIEASGHFMLLKKAAGIGDLVKFASMWTMVGMVVLSFCADEYQSLRDQIRIPFVVDDGFFKNKGRICNIAIDDYGGGRQVGALFRRHGHTRALYLADNHICMDWERYQGFRAGFLGDNGNCADASAGCAPRENCSDASAGSAAPGELRADFMEIPMRKDERIAFYGRRLGEITSYTAVFAASDYYAAELMRVLQGRGIRVPDDVSVCGFDDSPLCLQTTPPLSSVRQDCAARAKRAVQLLMQMKADKSFSQNCVMPVQLVERGSTAAPPRAAEYRLRRSQSCGGKSQRARSFRLRPRTGGTTR